MNSSLQTQPAADDLLWQHLKTLPAFRALLRSVEARFYRRLELPGPVLDLGCGDGNFAQMAFPERRLEVGVDPWWNPLRKSRRQGVYGGAIQSFGDALPFAAHTFGSAISNSVLEHIPDVQMVLQETNRVLRPGGLLVVTMPSHYFTEKLGGARYFGDAYRRFFNRISRHAHTEPPEWWAERLAFAGFRVRRWQYYFSESALHALEIGHVQGLPSAILHALTGHWILGPWEENLRPVERWLRPYYEEPFPDQGAYMLIIAEKQSEGRLLPQLPPPNPFTLEELAEESPSVEVVSPGAPLPAETTELSDDQFAEQELAESGGDASASRPVPTPAAPPAAGSGSTIAVGLLALAALFAAASALGALTTDSGLVGPVGGLWPAGAISLGISILAFAGLVIYIRRGRPPIQLSRMLPANRRRWWYPASLMLAAMAGAVGGSTPFEGNWLIAILLWLTAAAVAAFALWPAGEGVIAPAGDPTTTAVSSATARVGLRNHWIVAAVLFGSALLIRVIGLTSHPFVLNGVEASLGLDAVAVSDGLIRNPFSVGWLTNPTLPSYLLTIPLALFGQTVFGMRIMSALVGALTVALLYLLGRRVWGEGVALTAAILLAGSHVHVHYSRLGMNNVWDPLLMFLPVVMAALALKERPARARRTWLVAGAVAGMACYFFTPSRLLPLVAVGALFYLLIASRERLRAHWRGMLFACAIALVIALPQLLYYNRNPGVFTERLGSVGILQSGWLAQETIVTGRTALDLLSTQFWQAALAFQTTVDMTTTYNPGIPLLRYVPALLFTFGLGLALARLRRFAWAVLLIWVGVTVIFAGALLISPPDSHRLLSAMPAVALLAAAPLAWLARQFVRDHPARKKYFMPALTLVAILLIAGDLLFYFGAYRTGGRFGDRNTEIAYGIATYLDSLEGPYTAYLHGPPAIYVEFPTIPFLATEFVPNINLFNVNEAGAPPADSLLPEGGTVFLFVPERAGEMSAIQEQYPGGEFLTFEGSFANPLFLAYRLP